MEETKSLNIAILQMCSEIGNIDANIQKVENLVNDSLPKHADVLILPEVWTVGWECSYFQKSAQSLSDSTVVEFLSGLAKKYNINIIGGSFITKQNGNFYNTCPVLDRNGRLLATYSKNHLYSYYGCNEDKYVKTGDNLIMVNFDGVNFGLSICYDIRFPEVYRAYAKSGADVLVNCAAWGSKKALQWEVMTKSRAVENQCFMVALTQVGHIKENEYNLGESRIIDFKGDELASIMNGEGIVCSKIDLDDMYKFRQKSPTLNDIRNKYEVKILCEKY